MGRRWRGAVIVLAGAMLAACTGGAPEQVARTPADLAVTTDVTEAPSPEVTDLGVLTVPGDELAACRDAGDDVDGARYARYPDRPRPLKGDPPGHAEIETVELGLSDDGLVVRFTMAGAVLAPGEAGPFPQWSGSITIFVNRTQTYYLTAVRDEEGAYAIGGTDLTDETTTKTRRGERTTFADVSFHDQGYGVEDRTLTIGVSRENLPLLDEDFHWTAEVSAWAGPPDDRTRAAFDMCPNLTPDERGALVGFPPKANGELSTPPRRLIRKLPGKP